MGKNNLQRTGKKICGLVVAQGSLLIQNNTNNTERLDRRLKPSWKGVTRDTCVNIQHVQHEMACYVKNKYKDICKNLKTRSGHHCRRIYLAHLKRGVSSRVVSGILTIYWVRVYVPKWGSTSEVIGYTSHRQGLHIVYRVAARTVFYPGPTWCPFLHFWRITVPTVHVG